MRLVNLQTGQLDMLEELAPSDAAKVEKDPKLKLRGVTSLGYEAIDINLAHGPAADNPLGKDARVRAALEAAIDRNALNQVVMDGRFVPDNQAELPTSPYFNTALPVPARDVARAKALLKEAGHDRVTFSLRTLNTPADMQIGEVLQSMAAEAGIDIKLVAGETNANIQAMNAGEYQANLVIWSGRSDPDFNIVQFLACDGFQNWGKVLQCEVRRCAEPGAGGDRSGAARGGVSRGRIDLSGGPAADLPVPHDVAVCAQRPIEGLHAGAGWADPSAGTGAGVGLSTMGFAALNPSYGDTLAIRRRMGRAQRNPSLPRSAMRTAKNPASAFP